MSENGLLSIDLGKECQAEIQGAKKLLEDVPGGVRRAVKAALGETTKTVRRESTAAIREVYDISAANIRAGQSIKSSISGSDDAMRAVIWFSGKKIPLHKYGGAWPSYPTQDIAAGKLPVMVRNRWTRQYPGVAAKGHQKRDTQPATFHHAFVAMMKSGHIGIFERPDRESEKIREIPGSSVPQMVENAVVTEKLQEAAKRDFAANLERAVAEILTGRL